MEGEEKDLGGGDPFFEEEGVSSPNPTSTKNLSHGGYRKTAHPVEKAFVFWGWQ